MTTTSPQIIRTVIHVAFADGTWHKYPFGGSGDRDPQAMLEAFVSMNPVSVQVHGAAYVKRVERIGSSGRFESILAAKVATR